MNVLYLGIEDWWNIPQIVCTWLYIIQHVPIIHIHLYSKSMVLRLPSFNSLTPCCFCPANASDIPWRDCRPDSAIWINRIWTPLTWLRSFAVHILFTLPGVTITNVLADVFHVKHLGTDMYFAGSVLWLLCYRILPGSCINFNWLASGVHWFRCA